MVLSSYHQVYMFKKKGVFTHTLDSSISSVVKKNGDEDTGGKYEGMHIVEDPEMKTLALYCP